MKVASRGINKVILIGNLGQEPEIRYMPNGGAVANISLATSENWRDKQTGEIKEKTEWHRVVVFGKMAEVAGEHLHKGSQIYIEGSLQTRKWQDQNGQDRYTTEVIVNIGGTMQMLGNRQNSNTTSPISNSNNKENHWSQSQSANKFSNSSQTHPTLQQKEMSINDEPTMDFDDDIPF